MSDWRGQFSDFGGKAYLDCSGQGPFPRETVEAVRDAIRLKEHPEEITPDLFQDLPHRARAAAARLIGCQPSSVTLGSGASHGMNLAAAGLPFERGDEVLVARGEFPAVALPFVNLAPAGVSLRWVDPESGRHVEAAAFARAVSPRTRAIAVSHVTFATGYRIDLAALGELCRRQGLFFIVDGAQSVGAVDFHVGEHPIDLLAVSGYKWLLSPYGTGFTYVSPRVVERMRVPAVNWQTVEGANQLNRPYDYGLKFREGAARFDAAETASFLNLSGFIASVEFLNRVRVPTIEAHAMRLIDRLVAGVGATPLRVVSDLAPAHRSTLLGLAAGSREETRRIWRRLGEAGVVAGLRDNLIRVAPNLYNTPDDIDRFLAAARG
ncbi:MAG TPA: aminotransferase class V-fold PLP-dependent enzyme [Candidatus Polarisedimenticolia bacterium]|nr:aminotransferase class V-fold PLP-dependent enzyme [Candidatus Polarisedimenticolia bacterium]